jgi:phosphocarrier protein HPr
LELPKQFYKHKYQEKNMIETTVVVNHKVGLHARPASIFVQTAKKFTAAIKVKNVTTGGTPVDAKSIISVLTLGVMKDHVIHLEAEGADADEAINSLKNLVLENFGEIAG